MRSTPSRRAHSETLPPVSRSICDNSAAPPWPGAGAAAVGGAAAALMASGRAEALAEERPAAVETEPDPLELLGLAPAPFDVDAT